MSFDLHEFTIRRKVLKIFGAAFHVYDPAGNVIAYCKQKAFKLKEDIRLYTDESATTELLTIQARQIVDFSAAYDIVDSQENRKVGAARRKGWSSILRDSWEILDADDAPIGRITEDSTLMAMMRRVLSNLIPQSFSLTSNAEEHLATLKVHFNPFIYRMTVSVSSPEIDPRVVFGAAVLLAAVEQRQS